MSHALSSCHLLSSPHKLTQVEEKTLYSSSLNTTSIRAKMPTYSPTGSFNVVQRLSKRRLLIAINFLAGLSIFFFGYDQGMMGGVNNAKDYIDTMGLGYVDDGTNAVHITNTLLQGGIVSVYYLGTLLGALLGGSVGDRVGRIKTIGLGAGWAILGATLQCSAQNKDWMLCARLINGIGTGILNAIVPVWATETAEHTSRGQFIAIEFTLNIFGVVVAYWLELYGAPFESLKSRLLT